MNKEEVEEIIDNKIFDLGKLSIFILGYIIIFAFFAWIISLSDITAPLGGISFQQSLAISFIYLLVSSILSVIVYAIGFGRGAQL